MKRELKVFSKWILVVGLRGYRTIPYEEGTERIW